MRMLNEIEISLDDICLLQGWSIANSRSDMNVDTEYAHNGQLYKVRNPMIIAPMVHTATKEMIRFAHETKMIFVMHRYFKEAKDQLDFVKTALNEESFSPNYWRDSKHIFFAVGRCQDWIDYLYKNGVRNFCIDFAHGNTLVCVETVKHIKRLDENNIIMAGNVETYDGVNNLAHAGADFIRCGIASGSICATAKNTGIGRPIVSALIDCSKAVEDYFKEKNRKVYLIADGGIRNAADIAKAIAVGADFVMSGKLFASTSFGRGPLYNKQKQITEPLYDVRFATYCKNKWTNGEPYYAEYAGMASHRMRQLNHSHQVSGISIEGESGLIKYTGITQDLINNIEANLRASLSYVGSFNWNEFKDKVVIAKMSNAGIIEKQTHLDIND